MGIPVLIIGESGSGKTYSIKGFKPDEVGIFSVRKSRLPFREGSQYRIVKNADYNAIIKGLKEAKCKSMVIDDSQYLMADEYFAKAKDTGYQKFTDIGKNFADLLLYIQHMTPEDVVVYLLHHPQVDEHGIKRAKTVGKMVDNYLTIEGCVDVCLFVETDGKNHYFMTQSDGTNTAKSPEGMFEDVKVPNDLGMVDKAIRDYWM